MQRQNGFCRLFLLVFFTGLSHLLQGQTNDFWHNGGSGLWLGFQYRHAFNKQWLLQSDLQLRFRNNSSIYDYTLLRTGIYYQWKNGLQLGTGILYGHNDVQNKKKPAWENEYRFFQDLRWNTPTHATWKPGLQFRLEERWFDYTRFNSINEQIFALRYRLKADLRKELGTHWQLLAGDELMYQYIAGRMRFNQNRIALGAAYKLKKAEIQLILMRVIVDTKDQTILRLNLMF